MTVYKAIKPRGRGAADHRRGARAGREPPSVATTPDEQRHRGRPVSIIYDPVAVTKDNVKDTIVADGFWTAAEICTGPYKAACTAAGIQ